MKPWGLPDWMRQAIVDAYEANEKIEAISAEFSVTRQYVSVLARRHGLPPRQLQRKGKQSSDLMLLVNE